MLGIYSLLYISLFIISSSNILKETLNFISVKEDLNNVFLNSLYIGLDIYGQSTGLVQSTDLGLYCHFNGS